MRRATTPQPVPLPPLKQGGGDVGGVPHSLHEQPPTETSPILHPVAHLAHILRSALHTTTATHYHTQLQSSPKGDKEETGSRKASTKGRAAAAAREGR